MSREKHSKEKENKAQTPARLVQTEEGLVLTDGDRILKADFTSMLPRLKQANLEREMLVKAARIKGFEGSVRIVDATAGMGEDSLLLAAAGFEVVLFEQDPVIAALLADGLAQAQTHPVLGPIVARMEFHRGDSIAALKSMERTPDVVFLDPMFPERQKSGLIKKKFQLLQQLERPCSNEEELLSAAMEAGPRKIVIKRPLKGPFLAGRKPDYSIEGKAIRYDCILLTNHLVDDNIER